MNMKRRDFIKAAGASTLVASAAVISAPAVHAKSPVKWKMVTTWPLNFPGLGTDRKSVCRERV